MCKTMPEQMKERPVYEINSTQTVETNAEATIGASMTQTVEAGGVMQNMPGQTEETLPVTVPRVNADEVHEVTAAQDSQLMREEQPATRADSVNTMPITMDSSTVDYIQSGATAKDFLVGLKRYKSLFSSSYYKAVVNTLERYVKAKDDGANVREAADAVIEACMRYDMTRGGSRSTEKGAIRKHLVAQVGALVLSDSSQKSFESEESLASSMSAQESVSFRTLSKDEQAKAIQRKRVGMAQNLGDMHRMMRYLADSGDSELFRNMDSTLAKVTQGYFDTVPYDNDAFAAYAKDMQQKLADALYAANEYLNAREKNTSVKAFDRNETAQRITDLIRSDMQRLSEIPSGKLCETARRRKEATGRDVSWADILRESIRHTNMSRDGYEVTTVGDALSVRYIMQKDGEGHVVTPIRDTELYRSFLERVIPGDDPVMEKVYDAMSKVEFFATRNAKGELEPSAIAKLVVFPYLRGEGLDLGKKNLKAIRAHFKSLGADIESDELLEDILNSMIKPYNTQENRPINKEDLAKAAREGKISEIKALPLVIQEINSRFKGFNFMEGAGIEDGLGVDFRNVASTAVADLIGAGDIIARSEYVELDGQKAISMEMVDGVDLKRADHKNGTRRFAPPKAKADAAKMGEDTVDPAALIGDLGRFYKDCARLQVLDFLCAQTDRHGGNVIYTVQDAGGNILSADQTRTVSYDSVASIRAIDNDAAFGTIDDLGHVTGENVKIPDLSTLEYIDITTYNSVMQLTPASLCLSLGPYLTRKEMRAMDKRLAALKKHLSSLMSSGRVIDDAPSEDNAAKESEARARWQQIASSSWAKIKRQGGAGWRWNGYFRRFMRNMSDYMIDGFQAVEERREARRKAAAGKK